MKWIAALLIVLMPTSVFAETQPLAWAVKYRPIAAHTSDVLVAGQIVAETVASLRDEHRGHALGCQALRTGIVLGATEIVKRAVHRERPDGSDARSFYSGHTATAMSASGWRYQIGVPIAFGAGYFRMAANRHYLTDVLAGAGAGVLVSRICR